MPAAFYKKLGISKNDFRELLNKKYWDSGMSQSDIAKDMGCDVTCIEGYFKKLEIPSRSLSEASRNRRQRICKISDYEQEVIDGMLLSDFHLESGTFQARLSYGFCHKEFAQHFVESLPSLEWQAPKQNKKSLCWHSKSKFYENLMILRKKWYKKGVKIVPKDINITPTVLRYWYLGDGFVQRGRGPTKKACAAILCTDSFSEDDNIFLMEKLVENGIPCSYHKTRNRLRIPKNDGYRKMISYIRGCPVKCYDYKWKEEK